MDTSAPVTITASARITKEVFAKRITGREYPLQLTKDEITIASLSELVIVYGCSDDLMEIEGVIRDEVDVNDGGTAYFHSSGVLQHHGRCDCEYCNFPGVRDKCRSIEAVWCGGDGTWSYKSDIPHATFEIVEDDAVYCRGIVFDARELPDAMPVKSSRGERLHAIRS